MRRLRAAVLCAVLLGAGPGRAGPAPSVATWIDEVRAHVGRFWSVPPNVLGRDLTVEIRVGLRPDGTVTDAQAVNVPPGADPDWMAAAESARRAVRLASPLPMPRDNSDLFKTVVLVFNPNRMAGGR